MYTEYLTPIQSCAEDGFYVFSKTAPVEKEEEFTVHVYSSCRYVLRINGAYICEGPCKSHHYVHYYDTVKTVLKAGENHIEIYVMQLWGQRFTTAHKKQKPEVIFEAVSLSNRIASDASWDCIYDARCRFTDGNAWFLPPMEAVDFSEEGRAVPVTTAGGFDFEQGIQTSYGISFATLLEPRPIPMLMPLEDVSFTEVKRGENFVEFDAGQYVTAKVRFSLAAHTDVKIIYAECYEGENGKFMRDDTEGKLCGVCDTVKTIKEETYEPFYFRTFRYIRIEGEGAQSIAVRAARWNYPIKQEGTFSCSDRYFNQMFAVSINTMLCCTHETFYDCPYHEQQQYVMDSAIESAVLMRMTGDVRPIRKCIEEFAASQLPSGYLLANYPADYRQIIPGFSFFWIFMLHDYLEYTKDTAFVSRFIGTMDKILDGFSERLSKDGLIVKSRYWDFVDWVLSWPQGVPPVEEGEPLTVYNMYYAYALLCAARMRERLGRHGAEDDKTRYDALTQAIKKHCYDKEKGLYTDAGKPGEYSMHTIIWAILSELVAGEEAEKMAGKLKEDFLQKSSFSMHYYLFRALETCGKREEIFGFMDGWYKMIDMHCTTWCENPDNPRSECHAWSSSPLYELSKHVLGVAVGFEDEIIIAPLTLNMEYAKGSVPTRFGLVSVSWVNGKNRFSIEIKAPRGVKKRVVLPCGEEKCFGAEEEYIVIG